MSQTVRNKPLKVVYDYTPATDKKNAGIGSVASNLLRVMAKKLPAGSVLKVLTYEGEPDPGIEVSDGVEIDFLTLPRLSPIQQLLFKSSSIKNAISGLEDDFVFFSPYFLSTFPAGRMRSVVYIHDLILKIFDYYSDRGGIFHYIRKMEYSYWLNRLGHVNGLVYNSVTTKQDLERYIAGAKDKPNLVSYLGVDSQIIKSSKGADSNLPDWIKERGYILYMGGGIAQSKNTLGLLSIYKSILDMDPDAPVLVIAGKIFMKDGKISSVEIRDFIERNSLGDKVHFTGFYENTEGRAMLEECDAFIHPSLYEGFGIAPAEAILLSSPRVILHDGHTYREIFADYAELVDMSSYQEAAAEIVRILNEDPVSESKRNQLAKGLMQQYNWEDVGEKVFAFLYKVN